MVFNNSVAQGVQFASALEIQLCDQLEGILPNQTTNLDNSPDGLAIKIATKDFGTNDKTISSLEYPNKICERTPFKLKSDYAYYNPVTVRQLSLEKFRCKKLWRHVNTIREPCLMYLGSHCHPFVA